MASRDPARSRRHSRRRRSPTSSEEATSPADANTGEALADGPARLPSSARHTRTAWIPCEVLWSHARPRALTDPQAPPHAGLRHAAGEFGAAGLVRRRSRGTRYSALSAAQNATPRAWSSTSCTPPIARDSGTAGLGGCSAWPACLGMAVTRPSSSTARPSVRRARDPFAFPGQRLRM